MIVTIDGPSASGKSTAAQALAQKLHFYYLNTGLLYRALAYLLVTRESYTLENLADPVPEHLTQYLDPAYFSYHYDAGTAKIIFEGVDITAHLKDAANDQAASIVSLNPQVRDALLHLQRDIAQRHDIVIEGRDSGSVVFPTAEHKFFLTASLEERARRWQCMQATRGMVLTIEQVIHELQRRDTRDQERTIAPLRITDDAVVIDSTDLDLNQVVQEMMGFIK